MKECRRLFITLTCALSCNTQYVADSSLNSQHSTAACEAHGAGSVVGKGIPFVAPGFGS